MKIVIIPRAIKLSRRALITRGLAATTVLLAPAPNKASTVRSAAAQTINRSCELISDTAIRKVPSVPKPAYLQSYVDPNFGTTITRVSGDPGSTIPNIGGRWGRVVKHHYSLLQAWNCDQSLLYLETNKEGGSGGIILDGTYYQPLVAANPPRNSDQRWHPTNPDVMIYAANSTLGHWNVRNGALTPIRTFPDYKELHIGPWKGNLSLNGDRIVLNGIRLSDGHVAVFAYEISRDKKFPDIDVTIHYAGALDNSSVSPLGNYIQLQHSHDFTTIYTLLGEKVVDFSRYGRPSHYDLAVDESGDEVAVGVSKFKADPGGRIIKRRLRDGAVTVLTSGGYAQHTSCRDTRAFPPWAFISYDDPGGPSLYFGEITALSLDGSKVFRLCHHHSTHFDYEGEVHASPSPDGLRVVFVSNWGNSGGRPAQTYVLDLRQVCAV